MTVTGTTSVNRSEFVLNEQQEQEAQAFVDSFAQRHNVKFDFSDPKLKADAQGSVEAIAAAFESGQPTPEPVNRQSWTEPSPIPG